MCQVPPVTPAGIHLLDRPVWPAGKKSDWPAWNVTDGMFVQLSPKFLLFMFMRNKPSGFVKRSVWHVRLKDPRSVYFTTSFKLIIANGEWKIVSYLTSTRRLDQSNNYFKVINRCDNWVDHNRFWAPLVSISIRDTIGKLITNYCWLRWTPRFSCN